MYFCDDQYSLRRWTYTAGGHEVSVPSAAADLGILVVDL